MRRPSEWEAARHRLSHLQASGLPVAGGFCEYIGLDTEVYCGGVGSSSDDAGLRQISTYIQERLDHLSYWMVSVSITENEDISYFCPLERPRAEGI